MKLIPLTQGLFAQVDDEDFDYLNQFSWQVRKQRSGNCYASRCFPRLQGKQKYIYMHCEIMQTIGIDHIDGNGLNNQKNNLRKATQSKNSQNRAKTNRPCSSKYKGVYWHKFGNKWVALIWFNKKRIHLGSFTNEIEAAKAYDLKAKELFGEFAKTNF